MRHQVRTRKFGSGRDAERALLRKLSRNFFIKGKLTTTISKAKSLRPYVERIVNLAKKNTEGSKNVLLKKSGDKIMVSLLIKQIAPVFKEKQGGYVRIIKTGVRQTDGTQTGRLEWTLPVVLEVKKPEEKQTVKKEAKDKKPKQKKEAVALQKKSK